VAITILLITSVNNIFKTTGLFIAITNRIEITKNRKIKIMILFIESINRIV